MQAIKRAGNRANAKQLKSALIKSNTDRRIGHFSKAAEYNAETPTVIVLGWAYSKESHVQKHAEMHNLLGHNTLTHTIDPLVLFSFDSKRQQEIAQSLIDQIKRETTSGPLVFIHSFSNNGFCIYQHLGKLIEQDPKLEMCGAILDSCPGAWNPMGSFVPAFGNLAQYGDTLYISLVHYMFLLYRELKTGLMGAIKGGMKMLPILRRNWSTYTSPTPRIQTSPGLHLLEETLKFPLLLLYSAKDWMIPSSFIKVCAVKQREKGRLVQEVDFVSSGHVAHMKAYPQLYKDSVKTFMDNALENRKINK